MPQSGPSNTAVADPLVRSDAYRLLSLVFKYPSPALFEGYRSGEFTSELWDTLAELPYGQAVLAQAPDLPARVCAELGPLSATDLEVKFNQTFEVGAPEPPCPPYEGLYRKKLERTGILIEVAEYYKQFGLKMSPEEGKRELPDHLRAELEFLGFLAFKEAQARVEGTPELLAGYVRAQHDFLERHLAPWIQAFSEKLQSAASLELFAGAGRLLEGFVAAEQAYVRGVREGLPEDDPIEDGSERFAEPGAAAPQLTV